MQQATETMVLPFLAGGLERVGRYQLLREIGRGAMSLVYEARDTHSRRLVALKMLHVPQTLAPDQARAMLARFEREARAVAGLSHPNIVTIHDFGEEADRHFLVMEYLNGETLRERLDHGHLTPAQAAAILSQVASAVDAVHVNGVVHRDIKPSNVMLLPDGTAKLLDFGVARQNDDSTVTGTGALVGSPAYMSPEQVRGEQGTRASDIWALGALLYEMLAGRPPFAGNTIPAVLYQVTHVPPAPVVGVPTPVQRVLRRALEKNPARRYPTAMALADAFAASVPGTSAARPPRPQSWRWAPLLLVPVALGFGLVRLTERHPAVATHHAALSAAPAASAAPVPPNVLPTVHIYETTPPQAPAPHRLIVRRPAPVRRAQSFVMPLHRPLPVLVAVAKAHGVAKAVPQAAKRLAAPPRQIASLAAPRYLHRAEPSANADAEAFTPAPPPRRVFRGAIGAWHRPAGFWPRPHVFRGAQGDDGYDQQQQDKLNGYIYSPESP